MCCISLLAAPCGLPMICGALLQRRYPKIGIGLTLFGAIVLSFHIVPYGFSILLESGPTLSREFDFNLVAIRLWILAALVLAWCDIRLAIEYARMRRAPEAMN